MVRGGGGDEHIGMVALPKRILANVTTHRRSRRSVRMLQHGSTPLRLSYWLTTADSGRVRTEVVRGSALGVKFDRFR